MATVQSTEALRNDADAERLAERPGSSMILSAVMGMAEGVARCLDAWRIARGLAAQHPQRRATTKTADQRHILVLDGFARAAAVVCRRAFSGDEAPTVRGTEAFVEIVASFAWAARERLRALSFARDLKLGPRVRDVLWSEGEVERRMHSVLLHIEAEAREAFTVDELPHTLPTTKADVWRRLIEASQRYQALPDGAVNETAPWLMFVEFAVGRRVALADAMTPPSFVEALGSFARDIDGVPRTEHLNLARALIVTFGEVAGDYTKSARTLTNKARKAIRRDEKKRIA